MTEIEYRAILNQYEKDFAHLILKWNAKFFEHLYLNQKLDEIFKKADENKELSLEEMEEYLTIRSQNDRINSEFKIISTQTNEIWIKIQELDLMILKKGYHPIFIGVDKQNGRLRYYLDKPMEGK